MNIITQWLLFGNGQAFLYTMGGLLFCFISSFITWRIARRYNYLHWPAEQKRMLLAEAAERKAAVSENARLKKKYNDILTLQLGLQEYLNAHKVEKE